MSEVVGVRLPPDTSQSDLDDEADRLGYASRSEYLRDIIARRDELYEENKMTQQERRIQRLEDRVSQLEGDIYEDEGDGDEEDAEA